MNINDIKEYFSKLSLGMYIFILSIIWTILSFIYVSQHESDTNIELQQVQSSNIKYGIKSTNTKINSNTDTEDRTLKIDKKLDNFDISYGIEPIEADYLSDGDIDGVNAYEVTKLQKFLNTQGFNIKTDGIFRRETKVALKSFQRMHNLKADGIFAGKTRELINNLIYRGQ